MQKNSTILVAGASGLVGSATVRALISKGYTNIAGTYNSRPPDPNLLIPENYPIAASSPEKICFSCSDASTVYHNLPLYKVDLTSQEETGRLFQDIKPEYVFIAAARVGGIMANTTFRADFIHDNLLIHINIIHQSHLSKVKKLLYLGSTCIYPRDCPQPMKEEYLLASPLEYTNEPYAIAKIAGLKMCESFNIQYGTNYLSVMPTNLFGPGDNFDLEKAHVLPAMMRKMYLGKCLQEKNWEALRHDLNARPIDGVDGVSSEEKILNALQSHGVLSSSSLTSVSIWGTGKPKREFLWSEDMADACVFIMENVDFKDLVQDKEEIRNTHINIGSGEEASIADLALMIKEVVGFEGELYFNTQKPDGTPRKLTDVSRLHALGWKHSTSLNEGLKKFYAWYLS